MKTTATITLTRNELTLIETHGIELINLVSKELEIDDTFSPIVSKIFHEEVKFKMKASNLFGAVKYKLKMVDELEVKSTLEITEVGLSKLLELGLTVGEFILPLVKAVYVMSKDSERIARIKNINGELNELSRSDEETTVSVIK